MKAGKFRKLNIDLPQEPVTNDRPWLIAGWLSAFAFLFYTAYAYFKFKGML